jgi:hypothetical protein
MISSDEDGPVLEIVAGDREHSRDIDVWALTGQPSLVDAAVVLVINEALSVAAVGVEGAGTATQIPVFELTSAQTRALTRVGPKAYRYQIEATWPTDETAQPVLLMQGDVTVIQRKT